jgi:hypothetical protein
VIEYSSKCLGIENEKEREREREKKKKKERERGSRAKTQNGEVSTQQM